MRIDQIAQHLKDTVPGLSKKQGEEAYKSLVELIKTEANKETNTVVALPKLGKLTIKEKASYMGKNPSNGEDIEIPAMRKATFSAYDGFKESLNAELKK